MSLAIPLMHFDGQPFTTAVARAGGWSEERLTRSVAMGTIRRLVRGVYVDAAAEETIELRATALSLVAPQDAVVCRRTAAWLYGIDTLALHEHDERPAVDCVRPTRKRSTRLQLASGHSQTLLPGDVVNVQGLWVTSPLATAVHLARHLARPFALSAVDAMLHQNVVKLDELRTAVQRYPHHPHIVQARELISLGEPLTESPGESWLRLRMMDAGFPRPQVQVPVRGQDRDYRIDIGFSEPGADGSRIGLEYDSDQWHTGVAAEARDEGRRNELSDLGWTILPVRRGDVWGRSPDLELAVGDLLGLEPRLPRRW